MDKQEQKETATSVSRATSASAVRSSVMAIHLAIDVATSPWNVYTLRTVVAQTSRTQSSHPPGDIMLLY